MNIQATKKNEFKNILNQIQTSKQKAYAQVNSTLVELYWNIGKYISNEVKQKRWGRNTVKNLSLFIKDKEPNIKGFSDRNIWSMKQFYEAYPKNKKLPSVMAELPQSVNQTFKDSYIFEFLDLPIPHKEKELQTALVASLKDFILELGIGFTFMGQEYKVEVGDKKFSIDLLFFHRELQCLIAFELKTNEFSPQHLGQLEFYLEALDRDVKLPHENPSIGVLLCREKNDEVVKYALNRSVSPLVIADYETKLIPKKLLQDKLNEIYELLKANDE